MKATQLIAECVGDQQCFYCGSPAGEIPLVLSSSFCDWWEVAYADSSVVCAGCKWMLDEKRAIPGKDKLQKTRNYSWLIVAGKQQHFTKADKAWALQMLLNPPPAPWAMAFAESGQKHVLFRCDVNESDSAPWRVQIEEARVDYDPGLLQARLDVARNVVAAVGHTSASEPINSSISIRLAEYHGPSWEQLQEWFSSNTSPLSRLVMFLCPDQKECQNACPRYVDPIAVSPAAGGTGRSRRRNGRLFDE